MIFLFNRVIFRFHVNSQECNMGFFGGSHFCDNKVLGVAFPLVNYQRCCSYN